MGGVVARSLTSDRATTPPSNRAAARRVPAAALRIGVPAALRFEVPAALRFEGPAGVAGASRLPATPSYALSVGTLVLLRHGESAWNAEGLFTGWVDVGLSAKGEDEARAGGKLLLDVGVLADIVHTSVLTRAIQTANIALETAELAWLPVRRSWRLNERHYGALQGKNKAQTRTEFGDEQFMLWRRSYDVPPPPLPDDDPLSQVRDPRYASLPAEVIPRTECLKDVVGRMLPYWYDGIVPDLAAGRTVLIVAHGNSLRALVKYLDGISDADIAGLNIPTGIPLLYELDASFRAVRPGEYLDPAAAEQAAEAVRNQGR